MSAVWWEKSFDAILATRNALSAFMRHRVSSRGHSD